MAGPQLNKKIIKKKKIASVVASSSEGVEGEDYMQQNVGYQEFGSQKIESQSTRDAEVRKITQVFNFGDTPSFLTLLGDFFQNFEAQVGPDVVIGDNALPLSPVVPATSPMIAAADAVVENVIVASEKQLEESEILVMASQGTAEASSQRFGAPTPQGVEVTNDDTDMGGGDACVSEAAAQRVETHKGTMIATLDFDDSDEDVFDEEAQDARAARLNDCTVDVNTGEKVDCQLEKGVTTGQFTFFLDPLLSSFKEKIFVVVVVVLYFINSIFDYVSYFSDEIFPDSMSQKETTVDVEKMVEVVQEIATLAEVQEPIPVWS